MPVFLTEYFSITDPFNAFDRFMEGIELSMHLKNIPKHIIGKNQYNPVDMLKTVLFVFVDKGYCSLCGNSKTIKNFCSCISCFPRSALLPRMGLHPVPLKLADFLLRCRTNDMLSGIQASYIHTGHGTFCLHKVIVARGAGIK